MAEFSFQANGFCVFNNVSIAAKYALEVHGLDRVMILDWDVHHGNGIQHMFYESDKVLYVSLHRFDHGTFFPTRPDAGADFVGSGRGMCQILISSWCEFLHARLDIKLTPLIFLGWRWRGNDKPFVLWGK